MTALKPASIRPHPEGVELLAVGPIRAGGMVAVLLAVLLILAALPVRAARVEIAPACGCATPTLLDATYPRDRAMLRPETGRLPVGCGDRRAEGRGAGASGSSEWVLPPAAIDEPVVRRPGIAARTFCALANIEWRRQAFAPRGPPALAFG